MGSAKNRSNVEIVADTYEAFGRGDIPAVLSMLDDFVEWHMADNHTYATGTSLIGPQAVVEAVFARIPQDFDGFTVDVQRIVGCGDTVLAEIRYRATSKATGKSLDAQAAHVFDFRDGRCVRYQQYADTWHFADVTGVVPDLKTVAR
jgi:ketosteroid isomerase-like protein